MKRLLTVFALVIFGLSAYSAHAASIYSGFQPTQRATIEVKPLATNRIRSSRYAYNDPRKFPEYRSRLFRQDYEPNYNRSEYTGIVRSLRRRELRRASYDDVRPYSIYSRNYTRDFYDSAPESLDNEVAVSRLTGNQYAEPNHYYVTNQRVRYPTGLRYWNYWRRRKEASSPTQYSNVHYRSVPSRSSTTSSTPSVYSRENRTNQNLYRSRQNYPRTSQRSWQPRTGGVGSRYNTTQTQDFGQAVLTIRPTSIDRDFVNGTTQNTPVFQIGFRNAASRSSRTLPPVFELKKMRFVLQDREGVFSDYSDFFLDIDGSRVFFDQDGDITVNFSRVRAAAGESRAFDVRFGVTDDNLIPRRSGSLRLVVEDAQVVQEYTSREVNYQISGNRSSSFISFNPFLNTTSTGNGTVAGNTSTLIFGKNLAAGAREKVLAIRIGADNSDSAVLRSVTVRETQSGGSIDSWSRKLDMVLEPSGRVLGSTRFVNGRANFQLDRGIVINRGSQIVLSFRIHLSSNIRTNTQNTSFKLMIDENDIDAYSYATGRDITSKIVNIDSETFSVSQASGAVGSSGSSSQPSLITIGRPAPLYRFNLSNPSREHISIARVSIDVRPVGVGFGGGSLSTDDFELKQFVSGRDRDAGFVTTSASGNTVTFDHGSELTIPPGSTFTFTVNGSFENRTVTDPYVAIQVLGDSGFQSGTLATLRAAGKRFIWSDNSATPHTTSTADWISGSNFNGIPTNTKVIR